MPLYEYQCRQCGSKTEVLQKVGDPALESCEGCGGELRRLLSAPAFQFKGTGWYVTDYARKGERGKGQEATANGASSASTGDGKAAATDSSVKSVKTTSGDAKSGEASGAATPGNT